MLTGKQTNTLPVGLSSLETQPASRSRCLARRPWWRIAPVLVLLPFLRKYLIKGLSLGALK